MNVSQLLGLGGTGLVIAGYAPQIHHLIKERCTAGLSLPAFAVWSLASLLFLTHAVLIRDLVFVGVQVVNLVAGGVIVAFARDTTDTCARIISGPDSASARKGTSRGVALTGIRCEAPGAWRRSHRAVNRAIS